ncbi:MAG: bifunctional adenosylcobinamide kinase/adenosylcobinamide-phosphate guanylyltransferase [Candidatus Omnitrophica bacterium]|nr:bifunctional adenosylcobinamide kinase/adenosylcobinamide-phosphate guanylyltransferase [Candidatus Omnitrophota bacterium]
MGKARRPTSHRIVNSFTTDFVEGVKVARRTSRLILLTGATRSGKSRLAVTFAKRFGSRIVYLATCRPADRDMKRRVARHQQERPRSWTTLEAPDDPAAVLAKQNGFVDGAILDCLTMYVSRLLMRRLSDEAILTRIRTLCQAMRQAPFPMVIVTNEVGWGVVPATRLGRRFRDLAGFVNQLVAQHADDVYLVVAGLPLRLKGNGLTIGAAYDPDRDVLRAR